MRSKIEFPRKFRKGGFTLVELIVVLMILAILAALLIPSLTGYIDKAKEKALIAQTRQAVMAAQTVIDEEYAIGEVKKSETSYEVFDGSEIYALAELEGRGTISGIVLENGKIVEMVWTPEDGEACTYSYGTEGAVYQVGEEPET